MQRDQTAIVRAISRHYGQRPEERTRVAKEQEKFSDWRAKCPRCGTELLGTLAELKGHSCG